MTLTSILIAALALIAVLLFLRYLRLERFHVANRGVNQSGGVTLLRALWRTVWLMLRYGIPIYLLVTAYFYLYTRRDCGNTLDGQVAYDAQPVAEHVTDALRWPARIDDGPLCQSER